MNSAEKRSSAPMSGTDVDIARFKKSFFSQLAGPLEIVLGNRKDAVAVKKVVEQVLVDTLAGMSSHQLTNAGTTGRASRNSTAKFEGSQKLGSLPTEDLKADEVIKSDLVEMSLSQLYRATQQGRFYCARPRGKSNGRVYPSWQFVDPVPDMLPEVLSMLHEKGERQIHGRMVTEEDSLNELSPAEVLAGRAFKARDQLHPAQSAMLSLSMPERLALVKELFEAPLRETAIG